MVIVWLQAAKRFHPYRLLDCLLGRSEGCQSLLTHILGASRNLVIAQCNPVYLSQDPTTLINLTRGYDAFCLTPSFLSLLSVTCHRPSFSRAKPIVVSMLSLKRPSARNITKRPLPKTILSVLYFPTHRTCHKSQILQRDSRDSFAHRGWWVEEKISGNLRSFWCLGK